MEGNTQRFKRKVINSLIALTSILLIIGTFAVFETVAQTKNEHGSETAVTTGTAQTSSGNSLAYIAAALAFGLGAIGAGLGVASVGSAAVGAVAEKPDIFGQALIFVALAEGIVIFGFIVALMILGKIA